MTVRLLKGLDNAGRFHTEPKALLEQREIRPLFRRSDGTLDAKVITPRGERDVKLTPHCLWIETGSRDEDGTP